MLSFRGCLPNLMLINKVALFKLWFSFLVSVISDPPENAAEVEDSILTPSLKVMYEEWEERIFDGEGCWKALVTRHLVK